MSQHGRDDGLPEGIHSFLDTDLYKLTMQAALLQHYPNIEASYIYINRTKSMKLNYEAYTWLKAQINALAALRVTEEEISWLRKNCSYLPNKYLDFLQSFRVYPEKQVTLEWNEEKQDISITMHGRWIDTILYEIPILALVSESYFRFVDTDWDYVGQYERAFLKAERLIRGGCVLSEFGSRRRRDYHTHDLVVQGLLAASKALDGPGKFQGTSNVHFAMKYNLTPIGTVAHEWFMGIAAITQDYLHANSHALRLWRDTYSNQLGIALTDTFSTEIFLRDFTEDLATKCSGVRQDSGDPIAFVPRIVRHYKEHNVNPQDKTIVFSDSLDVERCLELKKWADRHGIRSSFGVGTFLTSSFRLFVTLTEDDFLKKRAVEKSQPMNIVIKIRSADGQPCVKISDDLTKNTGLEDQVRWVKEQLGLLPRDRKSIDNGEKFPGK